jgi:hypothetical protein
MSKCDRPPKATDVAKDLPRRARRKDCGQWSQAPTKPFHRSWPRSTNWSKLSSIYKDSSARRTSPSTASLLSSAMSKCDRPPKATDVAKDLPRRARRKDCGQWSQQRAREAGEIGRARGATARSRQGQPRRPRQVSPSASLEPVSAGRLELLLKCCDLLLVRAVVDLVRERRLGFGDTQLRSRRSQRAREAGEIGRARGATARSRQGQPRRPRQVLLLKCCDLLLVRAVVDLVRERRLGFGDTQLR